jgi:hypothetical protein
MGYWMTHTGLMPPPRDPAYDHLPIFLGIPLLDGPPEQSVGTELEAFGVFFGANSSGLGVSMLKAQLLAAKLNVIAFPGFGDAFLPGGDRVSEVIAQADQILDGLANGIAHTKGEIVLVKDKLDAANNNGDNQVLEICEKSVIVFAGVPGDYDGDGFSDEAEAELGTSTVTPCGPSGWPLDIIEGARPNTVDLQDLASFIGPVRRIGASPGDPGYHRRWDIVPGSTFGPAINLQDITVFLSSEPPMLGGQRAFGSSCPY